MKNWQAFSWQTDLWQQVVARNKSDTLAHAYLMRGLPGVGKFQFAKAVAAYLLCLTPENDQACGHCKECELLQAGTHPDIVIIEPDDPGRPIRIDKIRRLNEFAHKTAQQGGRRIIIINPAEAMNVNSANALLKCLEEPGKDTLFFLISTRAGDMLPTIRSRCQQLTFATPDRALAENWLNEQLSAASFEGGDKNVSLETIPQLLDLVVNAPLEARRFAKEGLLEKRSDLAKGVKGLFKGALIPVELAKVWQTSDLPLTLAWLGSWLDDAVKLGLGAGEESVRNKDLGKMLSYIATKSHSRQILEERDWLMTQRQSLMEGGNLNPQMLMEGAFSRYLNLVL